jgi:predicted ArsR family transcriptional regulator
MQQLPRTGSLSHLTDTHRQLLRTIGSWRTAEDVAKVLGERRAYNQLASLAARGLIERAGSLPSVARGRPRLVWRLTDFGRLVLEYRQAEAA